MLRNFAVKERTSAAKAARLRSVYVVAEATTHKDSGLGQSAGRQAFVARGVRDGADLLLDRGLLHVELLQVVRGKTPTESGFRNQLHVLRGGFLMHGDFRAANFGEISLQGVQGFARRNVRGARRDCGGVAQDSRVDAVELHATFEVGNLRVEF